MRPRITLEDHLIRRCTEYGEGVVDHYRSGHNDHSRAYSEGGAELDVGLQARGKMAEVAFALIVGRSVEVLDWDASTPDGGWDIVHQGYRVDVKTTWLNNGFMIWNRTKNGIFDRKRFAILALVRGTPPVFEWTGWISKAEFRAKRQVATEGHKLYPGTWHIAVDLLSPPATFPMTPSFYRTTYLPMSGSYA